MPENRYLAGLKRRRKDTSLRSNIVFGQTTGWLLTIIGAFHYFVLVEDQYWFLLMLGNALLFLGLGAPQALELPQHFLEKTGGFLSTQIFRVILASVYLLVISPLGMMKQLFSGRAPFYYWNADCNVSFESWSKKIVSADTKISPSEPALFQLMRHIIGSGDLVIMPGLLLILVFGLIAVFIQTTPLAPMIYTLF